MKQRMPKQLIVMLIFSGLIGIGGIVLLSTSKAAELSLGLVNVSLKDKTDTTQTATQTATKAGDLNNDGKINDVDLSKFLTGFADKDSSLDLNKDGVVDNKDLDLLVANFQR